MRRFIGRLVLLSFIPISDCSHRRALRAGEQFADVNGVRLSYLVQGKGPMLVVQAPGEEFLFLKPGEEESWCGNVEGTLVKAGKYQIVGVYMPDYDLVRELVGLPEARGLLIADCSQVRTDYYHD